MSNKLVLNSTERSGFAWIFSLCPKYCFTFVFDLLRDSFVIAGISKSNFMDKDIDINAKKISPIDSPV
ncbi:hypothetical protein, partial [Companilactobacillus nantensis]|uniref:hypothetical protein n=2 Tax=Companilactobacillus nantensis TaxID=305793 RepID=UPI0011BEBB04